MTAAGGQPHEVVINGLTPNTKYYYRMIYDGDGDVEDVILKRGLSILSIPNGQRAAVLPSQNSRFARFV